MVRANSSSQTNWNRKQSARFYSGGHQLKEQMGVRGCSRGVIGMGGILGSKGDIGMDVMIAFHDAIRKCQCLDFLSSSKWDCSLQEAQAFVLAQKHQGEIKNATFSHFKISQA